MDIKKDNKNDLLKRREIIAEIESEKGLSYDEVRKLISEKSRKAEENIDVRRVNGNFGKKVFIIEAYIYDSNEDLNKMKKLEMTAKKRKEEEKVSKDKVKVSGDGGEAVPVEEKSE